MAYSTEVNDKIINFFSRAQTRIADNAEEDVTLIYEGDTLEYKQKFEDNLIETQDLSFFIFALDNQYNDWTEDEIVQYVDYFDVQYKLTNIPYVEREEYNLSIFIPSQEESGGVTSYNDLTDKPDLTVYAVKSNNLSDLTNASTARTNLGLSAIASTGLTDGNGTTANGTAVDLGGNVSGNILLLVPDDGTTFVIQKANGGTTYSSIISVQETLLEIGLSDGVSEETKISFNLNTGVCTFSATSPDTILYPEGSNTTDANGMINKTYVDKTRPNPTSLTDGSAISWDWNSKYFELKTLTTTNTSITLTLSNVVAGANQILSIVKNTASDVTISLAGTGLSFYGYNDAAYGATPNVVLAGASGDVFDVSFLARTATSIGVAIGRNGN